MNLEPIIQIEVSQKKKNNHCILSYISGVQKDSTDEPIYRTAVKIQKYRKNLWTQGMGEGRRGQAVWRE